MIEMPIDQTKTAMPNIIISWKGWETDLSMLRSFGWDVNLSYNRSRTSRYRLQLRNPFTRLIGTIKIPKDRWDRAIDKGWNLYLILDDMYGDHTKRNRGCHPPKAFADIKYSPEDVPDLLELINALLEPARTQQIKDYELPQADIIKIAAFIKERTRHV